MATFLGFIGMAVPEFMLALVMMYVGFRYFGQSVGGLFSPEYADAAWNLGKLLDLSRTSGSRSSWSAWPARPG